MKQIKQLEEGHGIKATRGKFGKKETAVIRVLVDEYLSKNNVPLCDFVSILVDRKHNVKSKVGEIFKEIALKLNNGRPIISIYLNLRRMYHPGNYLGKWSKEDDLHLLRLFATYGPNWETISKTLGRTDLNCRDRYRNIQQEFNQGKWTKDEEGALVQAVAELQTQQLPCPFWVAVSEKMGTRSPVKCLIKWKESLRPGTNPGWSEYEDFKLLSKIYEEGYEDEQEISWMKLAEISGLQSWTSRKLAYRWKMLKKRVGTRLNDHQMDNLDTVVETLLRDLAPLSSKWIASVPNGEELVRETWQMIDSYKLCPA